MDELSVDELKVLAEAGDPVAQFHLSNRYLVGATGLIQDAIEAKRLMGLSAEAGFVEAQIASSPMMSSCRSGGRSVTPEEYFAGLEEAVIALMWANVAASRSSGDLHDAAVRIRDRCNAFLSPAATLLAPGQVEVWIQQAQRRAREWDAAHPREP